MTPRLGRIATSSLRLCLSLRDTRLRASRVFRGIRLQEVRRYRAVRSRASVGRILTCISPAGRKKDADGKVKSWTIEVNSIPAMRRSAGIQRQDFLDNVGKNIVIRGWSNQKPVWHPVNRAAAGNDSRLSDGRLHIVGQDVEGLGLNKGSVAQ